MVLFVSLDFQARLEVLEFVGVTRSSGGTVELFVSTGRKSEFVFLTDSRVGLWDANAKMERQGFLRSEVAMVSKEEISHGSQLHLQLLDGRDEKLAGVWDPKNAGLIGLFALVFSGNSSRARELYSDLIVDSRKREISEPPYVSSPSNEEEQNLAQLWREQAAAKNSTNPITSGAMVENDDSGTLNDSPEPPASLKGPKQAVAAEAPQKTTQRPEVFRTTQTNQEDFFTNTRILRKLSDHLGAGDRVEVAIWSVGSGYLLSTQDRCIIAKISIAQSLMAGSFGGGRVASFFHSDINAIEYNSGLFNGVLEILTASYQGSPNKDFWRGTFSGRNADSNDPYVLSNTLPLARYEYEAVKPLIDIVRARISASKNSHQLNSPAPVSSDSLESLSALHDAGKLTDEEFSLAKAKLLGFGP